MHRCTGAARAASEQNLSQRIALRGPRGELVSMAAEVRQAAGHCERLIEALLVLARSDQARALTDPLDLAAVAEDALDGRTASGVRTTITLGDAPVAGDQVLLERLVANLLDNPERYNIPGGTVAISTTTDNGASLVRVANTGPVIPAGEVGRLFLPFTRLDDRTRRDGLGLALVSSIATVHNGAVHATAVAGGASTSPSASPAAATSTLQKKAQQRADARWLHRLLAGAAVNTRSLYGTDPGWLLHSGHASRLRRSRAADPRADLLRGRG